MISRHSNHNYLPMGNIDSTNMNTYYAPNVNMVAGTISLRRCISCLEEKLETEYKSITPSCRRVHEADMCTQCVRKWIQRSVSDRSAHITCPQCPSELDYFEVKDAADEATFQIYETLVLDRMLEQESSFEWCAHACGSGQLHPAATDEPIMTCHHCSKRTCVVHRLSWHSGVTCTQFDELLGRSHQAETSWQRRNKETTACLRVRQQLLEEQRVQAALEATIQRAKEEEASREEVLRTTKPCPNCKFDIEKDGGCDMMNCRKCDRTFCWECFVFYNVILSVGNSAHKSDCQWYRPAS
ncbi:hypothetical protein F4803DRAFT_175006 [Xylaria telfairii]|nr:hypothetical protein F4803DRAFT_175006 [Xylaria telfairii]